MKIPQLIEYLLALDPELEVVAQWEGVQCCILPENAVVEDGLLVFDVENYNQWGPQYAAKENWGTGFEEPEVAFVPRETRWVVSE